MTEWTEERRQRQREVILRNKPWEKSTGPKTQSGKKRSRMNAFKHGEYGRSGKIITNALRLGQAHVDAVNALIEAENEAFLLRNKLLMNRGKSDT